MTNDFIIDPNGNKMSRKDGLWHRTDGPAIELVNGDKCWYINGQRHRIDGPAYEYDNGKMWWVNDKLHRTDGPAVEWFNGSKAWYIDDRLHRANGPAIERANGTQEWWYDGVRETREKNYAREKPRLESQMHGLQIWLPIQTSGARFPLVNLIIDYGI
jgi:hypothetical protein